MQLTLPKRPIQLSLLDESIAKEKKAFDSKREALYQKYWDKLAVNPCLTRKLVSFQASKKAPFYRWFKYKEAFSSELVNYLCKLSKQEGYSSFRMLDPFAGAGTTLSVAAELGLNVTGIEILPVAVAANKARLLAFKVNIEVFSFHLKSLESVSFDQAISGTSSFKHLKITQGAFPEETERAISSFTAYINDIEDKEVKYLFWFACLSILEDVSFTRKDGQYLRWDLRSGRFLKSNFNKGEIWDFKSAITNKLHLMLEDIKRRHGRELGQNVEIIEASCLAELPGIPANSFDLVITSPPYANRYDYTRTYAIELAFMGYDDEAVKKLRQTLLSSTVENKSKRKQLGEEYANRNQNDFYSSAVSAFEKQEVLQEVLAALRQAKNERSLNNNNIPTLIENYFFEMNLVIHELARVLRPNGKIFMVNDNVRYHGEEIPVDLILSDFAQSAGLYVDHIWFLPRGKGNSSQQMGEHGREELRKGVYCWSKPISQ